MIFIWFLFVWFLIGCLMLVYSGYETNKTKREYSQNDQMMMLFIGPIVLIIAIGFSLYEFGQKLGKNNDPAQK